MWSYRRVLILNHAYMFVCFPDATNTYTEPLILRSNVIPERLRGDDGGDGKNSPSPLEPTTPSRSITCESIALTLSHTHSQVEFWWEFYFHYWSLVWWVTLSWPLTNTFGHAQTEYPHCHFWKQASLHPNVQTWNKNPFPPHSHFLLPLCISLSVCFVEPEVVRVLHYNAGRVQLVLCFHL